MFLYVDMHILYNIFYISTGDFAINNYLPVRFKKWVSALSYQSVYLSSVFCISSIISYQPTQEIPNRTAMFHNVKNSLYLANICGQWWIFHNSDNICQLLEARLKETVRKKETLLSFYILHNLYNMTVSHKKYGFTHTWYHNSNNHSVNCP